MPAMPKKIRRRRLPGELTVEQTRDREVIAAMLGRAGIGMSTDLNESAVCFLVAYWEDDPVAIAGIETDVDVALMRPLFVIESMRRRGVGASLIRAARMAAHTRGARTVYATVPAEFVGFLSRFGFAEVRDARLENGFGLLSMVQRKSLNNGPVCHTVCLDLSRYGLIER
jgi:N-acetylglutamate synthase-like GNAT family acetyltransferase